MHEVVNGSRRNDRFAFNEIWYTLRKYREEHSRPRHNNNNNNCEGKLVQSFLLPRSLRYSSVSLSHIMPFSVLCCARVHVIVECEDGRAFMPFLLANDKTQTRASILVCFPLPLYLYDFESPRQITNARLTGTRCLFACVLPALPHAHGVHEFRYSPVVLSAKFLFFFLSLRDFNALFVSFHHETNDARVYDARETASGACVVDAQFLDVTKATTHIGQRTLPIPRPNRRTRAVFLAECPVSLAGRTGIYETGGKSCYTDSPSRKIRQILNYW